MRCAQREGTTLLCPTHLFVEHPICAPRARHDIAAMRHLRLTAIVCAAILSALVTAAEDKIKLQADTRTTADQTAADTTCKANELIGMSLQNKSGDKLATVRDLAIDASSGR